MTQKKNYKFESYPSLCFLCILSWRKDALCWDLLRLLLTGRHRLSTATVVGLP